MPSTLSTWKSTDLSQRTATLTRTRDTARIFLQLIGNPGGEADAHLARLNLITDLCTKSTADSRRSLETLCNSETTSDDRRTYLSLVDKTNELLPILTDGEPLPAADLTQAPSTDEQCKDYLSVLSAAAVMENAKYCSTLTQGQQMQLILASIAEYCTKAQSSAGGGNYSPERDPYTDVGVAVVLQY
ncbi:hypothetical protein JCM24511_07203 [Saitozyma sp. JCM 24511]|nr:hypothetical protein JCM24511_07203 [Saitozyma sp. JCM 24511]